MRHSDYSDFTCKILVFWISGFLTRDGRIGKFNCIIMYNYT